MRRVTGSGRMRVDPQSEDPGHLQTATYLNNRYFDFERKLAYPECRDRDAWRLWRRRLRRALRSTLGLDRMGPVPTPDPIVLETVERDGYTRHKISYETLPGNVVFAYLLLPHTDSRRPAAICPHGHGMEGKEGVVDQEHAFGVAYGHELAMRGMVVLAPDNAGMGERDIPKEEVRKSSGCMLAWARLNHMGWDLTGLRIFDLMAGLNLLTARTDVDVRRIGCAGLSGGCWLSQVLTALDRRIKAVILSGFFTTFVQTVWHGHCICHHPHGIGLFCDLPDLSALIAPRPQFVESGIQDTSYPHEPAYSMVRKAYGLLDAEERLEIDRYDGGHLFRGEVSIPWLVSRLG